MRRIGSTAATGGRMLAIWQQPLRIDQPLPPMPLALTEDQAVIVDLESTYQRAAVDSYLE